MQSDQIRTKLETHHEYRCLVTLAAQCFFFFWWSVPFKKREPRISLAIALFLSRSLSLSLSLSLCLSLSLSLSLIALSSLSLSLSPLHSLSTLSSLSLSRSLSSLSLSLSLSLLSLYSLSLSLSRSLSLSLSLSRSLSHTHTAAVEWEGGAAVSNRERAWVYPQSARSAVVLAAVEYVCRAELNVCVVTAELPPQPLSLTLFRVRSPSWWSKTGSWPAAGSPPVEELSRAARLIPTDANSYATPRLGATTSCPSACQVGPSRETLCLIVWQLVSIRMGNCSSSLLSLNVLAACCRLNVCLTPDGSPN